MPSLLFCAPCEKVIVDTNNALSMISVLEQVQVQIIKGVALPQNSVIPMKWAIVCLWEQSSNWDAGKTFEQRTALVSESGAHLIEQVATFVFDKPRHRVVHEILGMPISAPGSHKIKVWIRDQAEQPKEWKEVATYEMKIETLPPRDSPIPSSVLN